MIEVLAELDVAGWALHYGTVLLRIVGLFVFLPVFGSRTLPVRVRMAIAAVLAFVFLPTVPQLPLQESGVVTWVIVGLRELSAGFALGIAARVVFAGVESAAGLVSGQSGFTLASMLDPISGDQSVAPILFLNLVMTALFVTADLHHWFILGITRSYELLPPAIAFPDTGSLQAVTGMLGMRLFALSVELAAPALLITVTMDVLMVLVGKAMPQVPILIVGYPFKMIAGLVAFGVLVVATGSAIRWLGRAMTDDAAVLLKALGGS